LSGIGLMRTIGTVVFAVVALGMSAMMAAAIVVGLRLSTPRPATVGAPPANLVRAEVVEIPSASGAVLRAWWVPADEPDAGAVVLLHGVWENRRRMLRRAEVLSAEGYAVLLPDLQAHGESNGWRITFGGLESRDAAAAVGFVRARLPGVRIGLIGVSLGGGPPCWRRRRSAWMR
jgi:pimeloyl-ACP methyl ester carboxylesterase